MEGHILRMDKNSKCETALTWTPEGRRKVGRPMTTWRSTVEMKDTCWTGTAGTRPDVEQLTERAGEDALRPYGPLGPKRICEVRCYWIEIS